nr:uncharacterized protein LOC127328420 [Lolium perenne]
MFSPPPSSFHPPPPHSDVPAVLSPAEITATLRDLTTAVQEICLFLAGPYGPPPAAALLLWPVPTGLRCDRRAAAADAAAVVAATRRRAAAVPAAAAHHLQAGPYLGAGGPSSPAAGRLLPHRDTATAAATNAAAAAAVLTDVVPAVRWAAATAAATFVATNTAAAAAAATDAVPAFRQCGSDLGPGLYIDTARDALPPGLFPSVAVTVTASGLDRYLPHVSGGEAAGCCARPPSASACAGDA